jgi:hypothetical protein
MSSFLLVLILLSIARVPEMFFNLQIYYVFLLLALMVLIIDLLPP